MQQRPRQSRRFACDRCRTYKLRCERSSSQGPSCDRCARSGASCQTTKNGDGRALRGPHCSPRTSFSSRQGSTTGSPQGVAHLSSSRDQQAHSTANMGDVVPVPDLGGAIEHDAMDIAISPARRASSLDFALSNFDFTDDSGPQTPGSGHQLDGGHRESLSSSLFDDLTDFNDSAIVMPSPVDNVSSLRGSGTHSHMQDLLELSGKLVEDYDALDAANDPCAQQWDFRGPSTVEIAIQSALNGTSRLCDILESMATVEAIPVQQCQPDAVGPLNDPLIQAPYLTPASIQQSGVSEHLAHASHRLSIAYPPTSEPAPPPRRKSRDLVLTTTLVSTYILLVRTWRRTFSRLDRLLVSTPLGTAGSVLELPSLQLGGFQVRSNFNLQILVLLELSTGMLQTIESSLGINHSGGFGKNNGITVEDAHAKRCAINMDPVSVSIRETLLSQETFRSHSEDAFGERSLKEIIDELKGHLERR